MRDFWLFVGSLLLAVGVWSWGHGQQVSEHQARESELVGLGAPDGLETSPARSRLVGEYLSGLQSEPTSDEYRRLAELFLVSHDLDGKKVRALAHNPELMARVLGDEFQFFSPKGEPWLLELQNLETSSPSSSLETLSSSEPVALSVDGVWILSQQGKRFGLFRAHESIVLGYFSNKQLTVEGDTLLIDGKRSWVWQNGELKDPH